jgi:malate/lactate dehydrogenase
LSEPAALTAPCARAAVNRGSAREIVLVNRTRKTAEAVATDLRYGTPLTTKVDIIDGDYDALGGAGVAQASAKRLAAQPTAATRKAGCASSTTQCAERCRDRSGACDARVHCWRAK